MAKTGFALLTGLLLWASPGLAAQELRLDNGLRVLLLPQPGRASAGIVVLFDVGGDHDPPGKSGLGHLVEHLYVTCAAGGTPSRDVEQYVKRYAAGWNAQTGDDYTVIAAIFPADRLEEELADAAARMGALQITPADLEREIPRLLHEVGNMFERVPLLASFNQARQRARPSPTGRRGGDPEEVVKIRPEDARDHWRRYYKPINAILVVTGGFDPKETRGRIRHLFGSISPGARRPDVSPPPSRIPDEPLVLRSAPPGAGGAVSWGFRAPSPADPRFPAFLVLTARLFRSSDPKGVHVIYPVLDDPGTLALRAATAPGETPAEASERVAAHLQRALAAPFRQEEVFLARTMYPNLGISPQALPTWGDLYGRAFGEGRRRQLGLRPRTLVAGLTELDSRRVQRAAAEIFARDRAAIVVVLPTE